MVQDLISKDSDSDSESGDEMSISWGAPHSASTRHHLHKHPLIAQNQAVNETQGQAIRDDDVAITAGQRDNTGNLNDDARDTRDLVYDVLNEINNAGNIGSKINANSGKEGESSGINRSPYEHRSRKK
jgi:hypothetical protein